MGLLPISEFSMGYIYSSSMVVEPVWTTGRMTASYWWFLDPQIQDRYQQLAVQKMSAMAAYCIALVSWPQKMMLMTTVKILRVVMTKGTMCCLNCLIILQTNTCPIVVRIERMKKSVLIFGCRLLKSIASLNCPDITAYVNDRMATHLFMCSNISSGRGWNSDFMAAWKSGRKPSATSDINSKMTPRGSVAFSLCFWSPPKLQRIMPEEMRLAIIIFLGPKAKLLSFTREQKTPTSTTEMILQDLTSMTMGKLVRQMATMQVWVLMQTMMAHAMRLVAGI